MAWLMEILRSFSEKQLLIKYYLIKHLILLKIQNMTDILQWFLIFFKKNYLGNGAKNKIMPDKQLSEELHQPITRKFEK